MLVRSQIAERVLGGRDVLIPAIKLTRMPGIFVDDDIGSVTYYHILLDQHEVIFAEGAPSESLFTGAEALRALGPDAQEGILALFPDVTELGYAPKPACPIH